MENNLHQALDSVQRRILTQFSDFNNRQKEAQAQLELSVNNNSKQLITHLEELENRMDELKSSAWDNLSSKLKDFQNTFEETLK